MNHPTTDHAIILILAVTVSDFYALLMPVPAQNYEASYSGPCRNIDISWDGPQFLSNCLCRCLLKTMNHPTPEYAGVFISAGTVFNFYAFVYAGACLKL